MSAVALLPPDSAPELPSGVRAETYRAEALPALFDRLDALGAEGRYVFLDLHGLPRLRADQLQRLVRTQSALRRGGGELLLAGVQASVQALLSMLGLDDQLVCCADLTGALDRWKQTVEDEQRRLTRAPKLRLVESDGTLPEGCDAGSLVSVFVRPEELPRLPTLAERARSAGVRELCLDCSELGALSGEALRPLIEARRRFTQGGGRVRLCRVDPALEPGLSLLAGVPIHREPEDALRAARLERAVEEPEAATPHALPAGPALPDRVAAALADGERAVAIDASGWEQLGEAEVELLLQARERIAAASGRLAIAGLPGGARTVLRLLGIEHALPCFDDLAAADAALRAGELPPLAPLEVAAAETAPVEDAAAATEPDAAESPPTGQAPAAPGSATEVRERPRLLVAAPARAELPRLGAWLLGLPEGTSRALLEVAGLGSLQSLELEALLAVRDAARARGIRLALVCAPEVCRLLALLELDATAFFDARSTATAWLADEVDNALSGHEFEMVHCGIDVPSAYVHTCADPAPAARVAPVQEAKSTEGTRKPVMTDQRERFYWIADDATVKKLLEAQAAGAGADGSFLDDDAAMGTGDEGIPEARHKTAEMVAPSFLDDDEIPQARHKTAEMAAPSFLDDDDDEIPQARHKTAEMAAPSFLDDDDEIPQARHKTAEMAAPSFLDDDDDEIPQARHKTAEMVAPSFLDDDEDEAPAAPTPQGDEGLDVRRKTAEFSVPSFLTEEQEEEPKLPEARNKTAEFAVPSFLTEEEEEDEAAPAAESKLPESRNKTAEFAVPNFLDDEDDEEEVAPDGIKISSEAKTAKFGVPSFLNKEKEGEEGYVPETPRNKTAEFAVPNFLTEEESSSELQAVPERRKTAEFAVPNFLADEEDEEDALSEPAAAGDAPGKKKKSKSAEFKIPEFLQDGKPPPEPEPADEKDDKPEGFKSAEFKIPEYKGGEKAAPARARTEEPEAGDEKPAGFKSAEFRVPSEVDVFSGEEPDFALSDDAKRFQAAQTLIEPDEEGFSEFRSGEVDMAVRKAGFQAAKTMVDMEAPSFEDEDEDEEQDERQNFQAMRTMVDMEAPNLDDEEEEQDAETAKHRASFQAMRTMPERPVPQIEEAHEEKRAFQLARTIPEETDYAAALAEEDAKDDPAGFQSAQTLVDAEDIQPLKRTQANAADFQTSPTLPDSEDIGPLRRAPTEPEYDAVAAARRRVSGPHRALGAEPEEEAPAKKSPLPMIAVILVLLAVLGFGGYKLFVEDSGPSQQDKDAVLESLGTAVDKSIEAGLFPE